jgi:uncharacterized membrane protein
MIDDGRPKASLLLLSLFFVAAGVLHFVFPATYVRIIPPWLPQPLLLVYLAGAAEAAGGLGLLPRPTRRAAGIGLILLLIAVLPANVQMWLNAREGGSDAEQGLLLARIPAQLLLIWWVYGSAVRLRDSGAASN